MPLLLNTRLHNAFIVVSVIALIAYALYTQHYQGLKPCPLCITQRACYLLTAIVALIALIHHSRGAAARVYGGLIVLASGTGAGVAARQVWIQHLPADQVPACGPGLTYMFETFPLAEALQLLFMGDGNCAEVTWTFLSLSMPAWALIWFCLFIALGLWQLFGKTRA